ncbi:hypothetical protein Ndes2526B_g00476 [Nannochloris sp. 'desiccata']|nr:hypothetical protein KSW81_003245 [Chlorella desiccata (nom. nud.)]KAH7625091.1 putative Transmembrane protein 50-like protein [Chlorella desiccata (nom. nud.)]
MSSLASKFIYGDIDWDWWQENTRKWSPVVAGALFGAAWWSWADAIVFEHVSGAGSPPFKYCLPGIVATLALLLINLVSRDDLAEVSSTGDPGDNTRARAWLLFSFLLAISSVGGSIAVLISTSQAQQFTATGVGSVMQCGLILAASLLFWAFRSEGEGSSGYGFI